MIALLKGYAEEALAEGYAGLRITGAETWAIRNLPGAGRLLEYEARINDFLPGSGCLALCQYPMQRFSAPFLLDVLRTHPQVVIGAEVYDNPHYVPPSILLSTDRSSLDLRRWIADILQRKTNDAALRTAAKNWQMTFDAMLDPVLILQPDGTIRQCNQAFAEIVDEEGSALVGQKCFQIVHRTKGHVDGCPLLRSIQSKDREVMPMSVGTEEFLVVTDPEDGRQVIMNLVTNAWEALGHEKGEVDIAVKSVLDQSLFEGFNPAGGVPAQGPWVCIEVKDTGPGMDQNTLERLFDPFFTTKFTGRGLGMAVILGIVEACDGAIFVNSAPGKGTIVRVFFPALTNET